MKIETKTETVVTETVLIELDKEQAFAIWEVLIYLEKDSDWHLANNKVPTYKVESTPWAKEFFKDAAAKLEEHIHNMPSGTRDVLRTYHG